MACRVKTARLNSARRFHPLLVAIALLTPALPATATIVDLSSNTDGWTPIRYSNNNPDPSNDQQTGSSEGDIVGNALHPSAYTIFGDGGTPSTTDGTLGFRVPHFRLFALPRDVPQHVANGDDADRQSIFQHRQMAIPAHVHFVQSEGKRIAGRHGFRVGGHELPNG